MDWNVEKGQKGNNMLSSSLFWKCLLQFLVKMSQLDTENNQKLKIFQFSKVFQPQENEHTNNSQLLNLVTVGKEALLLPHLFFSPIFSTEKEKIQIKRFFLQNLPSTKFIFNFKGVTHSIQLT